MYPLRTWVSKKKLILVAKRELIYLDKFYLD